MPRKKSSPHFHTPPEKLNCAQAVLKGFQQEFSIADQEIEDYRAWGGGRAEGGMCGALFAAERLLRQAGKASVAAEFAGLAGDTGCVNIKKGKFPCVDCVRVADELVEKRME